VKHRDPRGLTKEGPLAKNDDPAPAPCAPREVVRHDQGGWISGPSLPPGTEPVPAGEVGPGDTLLLDDGVRAEVTDLREGFYRMPPGGRHLGIALGWKCGTASGVLFRRADDLLLRVAAGE
jgi:hypothetical protein